MLPLKSVEEVAELDDKIKVDKGTFANLVSICHGVSLIGVGTSAHVYAADVAPESLQLM